MDIGISHAGSARMVSTFPSEKMTPVRTTKSVAAFGLGRRQLSRVEHKRQLPEAQLVLVQHAQQGFATKGML
jgi:hypothetical protein